MAKEKITELSNENKINLSQFELLNYIIQNIENVIIGKRNVIELSLVALLARGHLLIEDVPGIGKTMLARSIAASLNLSYKRIQFTPDLLPSDITGVSIYNQKSGDFQFIPGPVFTHILLADEINRTPPRTQSSLLESMEEYQVTVDGNTYALSQPFFVMATVNSVEYHGTYHLPEAQLDRFLIRIKINYPKQNDEIKILEKQTKEHPINQLKAVCSKNDILNLQNEVSAIHIHPNLLEYIVCLIGATRQHPLIELGASPRGSLSLRRAVQALAFIRNRDYVLPDDIKYLFPYVISHRILLRPRARTENKNVPDILQDILDNQPVPTLPNLS